MDKLLITQRKSDNALRYYVNGYRVKQMTYYRLCNSRKDTFHTVETDTHFKRYVCVYY